MPEETAGEILEKIDDVENTDFNDLFKRMDEDFDLWNGNTPPVNVYDWNIMNETKAHGSDINIVSNDLRVFADSVQSTLASADMQIMVRMAEDTGEDKRYEIAKLERLLNFSLEKADERLRRLLLPPLRETLVWDSNIRGWTAGRFLVYKNKNGVIFDFMPLDPRHLVYMVGSEGIEWSGYKSYRTGISVLREYGVNPSKERDNLVVDYWRCDGDNRIWNGVICDDMFLKPEEEIKIPSFPILVMPVSSRPPIAGNVKGYGESIFAPTRHINAIRNRFASIVANHANLLANQALINYKDEQGVEITSTTNVPGGIITLPLGHNRLEPSPMKEISPTVVNMLNWLNSQLEQGVLPKIPIGTPAPSGTLYNLAQETGNRIFNPQLRNLSYFYADVCRLTEEQLIAGKLKVNVNGVEKGKYFETQVTPVELKKPHTIKVELTAHTPWSQLDTYQVADMAKRQGVPDSYIWEYILKFPDPKGLKDQASIEVAEHSPKLAMYNAIQALITYGRTEEAQQLMQDLMTAEIQETQGEPNVGTQRPVQFSEG